MRQAQAKGEEIVDKGEKQRMEKDLLDRKQALWERIREIEVALRDPVGCTADVSDFATDVETRARMLAEQTRCARQAEAVDEALAALKSSEYGLCECGEPIGAARLRANPLASLCVDCAAERERAQRPALQAQRYM